MRALRLSDPDPDSSSQCLRHCSPALESQTSLQCCQHWRLGWEALWGGHICMSPSKWILSDLLKVSVAILSVCCCSSEVESGWQFFFFLWLSISERQWRAFKRNCFFVPALWLTFFLSFCKTQNLKQNGKSITDYVYLSYGHGWHDDSITIKGRLIGLVTLDLILHYFERKISSLIFSCLWFSLRSTNISVIKSCALKRFVYFYFYPTLLHL